MCGITGFVTADGRTRPGREVLQAMTDVLAHRGPDGDGLHLDGPVGLGHRRLAIIDVAGGDQPLFARRDGRTEAALVFNGEIYNHVALRRELEARGRRPTTGSDGEVILHGYLEWGLEGMLRRLRGMYAFALHDARDGSLHLARDPFGIKPLFYAHDPEGLRFGSELKALLAARPGRPPLNRRGLLQTVCLGYALAPDTFYEGIASLPAGHAASWRNDRLTVRRHHALAFEPGREAADAGRLWQLLRDTVSSHLMSEVPLGAFLSGGVDSTAVVAGMAEVTTERVAAVSVGILAPGMDERPFAREAAAALGVTLHEEQAEPELLDLLPRLAWHLETPFADTSAAPTWLVCEAARRHVTVALSGDGGDENFAGYRRTRFDVLEERWRRRLPAPLRRGVLGPLGRAWPRGSWLPRPLRAGTLLRNLGGDWLDGYIHSLSRVPEAQARLLLRPEWRDDEPLRASFEGHAARAAHLDPLSRVQSMDFATWLADDILVKADRMSMAHGLEVRVPLLDTDFVEWAAGLPGEAKLAGGRGKVLFRRALRGHVPDAVLDRPKQGFHLPIGEWLRTGLRGRLDDVLADERAEVFEVFRRDGFQRLADEHQAERADRSAELWLLLMTDACLRWGPAGGRAAPGALAGAAR